MVTLSILSLVLLSPDTYIYIGWGMLLLLSVLMLFLFRRTHRRWPRIVILAAMLIFWWIFIWGSYVGVSQFEVVRLELVYDDLPRAFDGYRIVHFGDAHVGTLSGKRQKLLHTAVDSINAQHADVVVFTGDLQNREPEEIIQHKTLLKSIKARDGVYSVLGNHDYPMYLPSLSMKEKERKSMLARQIQKDIGWKLLTNSNSVIHRGQDSIYIAGMENDGTGRFPELGNMRLALEGVSDSAFVVMLEHDPSSWQRKILPYGKALPQLTLSGHTHGGQFSVLGLSPAAIMSRHHTGLYTSCKHDLFVTKGLSGVIPFRFGASPEIVVITLRCRH